MTPSEVRAQPLASRTVAKHVIDEQFHCMHTVAVLGSCIDDVAWLGLTKEEMIDPPHLCLGIEKASGNTAAKNGAEEDLWIDRDPPLALNDVDVAEAIRANDRRRA